MRFILKLFFVLVVIFSVLFVVKLLVDNWIYRISYPFLLDWGFFFWGCCLMVSSKSQRADSCLCFFDMGNCKRKHRCLVIRKALWSDVQGCYVIWCIVFWCVRFPFDVVKGMDLIKDFRLNENLLNEVL